MTSLNLPNPCLLAVVLTVSTHSGPQFVFHWPPDAAEERKDIAEFSDLLSDTSESGWSSSDEEGCPEPAINDLEPTFQVSMERSKPNTSSLLDKLQRPRPKTNSADLSRVSTSTKSDSPSIEPVDDHILEELVEPSVSSKEDDNRHVKLPWQTVLGFETDFLSELLCPQRTLCNTRFEMSVDDLAFVGLPVHVFPDGQWTRKKKEAPTASVQSTIVPSRKVSGPEKKQSFGSMLDTKVDLQQREQDLTSSGLLIEVARDFSSPLRMFHVAFVMNPPLTEYSYRLDQMYLYVVTGLVRTLRSEQAKYNYVWEEVSKMLKIRDRCLLEKSGIDDLYTELLAESSLAVALAELFRNISTNQIANITINGKLRSFQIPLISEFSQLPGLTESYIPGSVLTTNSPLDTPDGLDGHYAVLLLEDPESIIEGVKVDPYGALATAIRNMSPTISIQSLANSLNIDVRGLLDLTGSLIYWRRARAITPIHPRNFYAVSPLACIKDIYSYIPKFRQQFPTLPSLPRMLSMLSTGRPRPYTTLIPSRDHRDVYLRALEWLLRHGFVMHLRPFAWLRIPKQIKRAVFSDMQLEEEMTEVKIQNDDKKIKNADISTDNTSKQRAEKAASLSGKSPAASSGYEVSGSESGKNESSSSELGRDPGQDSILYDPGRASGVERRWVSKMAESKPAEWAPLFNKIVKYFNGRESLDKVCAIEHISRQDMRRFISVYEEYLLIVRHW